MFKPKGNFKSAATVGPGKQSNNAVKINNGREKNRASGALKIGRKETTEEERATLLKELSDPFGAAQIKAVESCLNQASLGLSITLGLWSIGLGCVLIRIADPYLIPDPVLNSYWIYFAPFWLGDIVGSKLLIRAYLIRFVTPEQQSILRRRYDSIASQSIDFQSATLLPAEIQGLGLGPLGQSVAVDIEYMPLVQRVVLRTILVIPLLLLFVIQQILACIELSSIDSDIWTVADLKFSMMECFSPLMILEVVGIMRVILIRTKGFFLFTSYFLVFLATLSIAAKIDGVKAILLADSSWVLALSPIILLIIMYFFLVIYLCVGSLFRRFQLTRAQMVSILLYCLSLIFLSGGLALLAALPNVQNILNWQYEIRREAPVVAIWFSVMLGLMGLCIAFIGNIQRQVSTKGFEAPIPLSKTSNGWEPCGARNEYWALLGTIFVRESQNVEALIQKLPQATMENRRNVSDVSASGWNGNNEDVCIPIAGHSRNNSGSSYDDVYDNL